MRHSIFHACRPVLSRESSKGNGLQTVNHYFLWMAESFTVFSKNLMKASAISLATDVTLKPLNDQPPPLVVDHNSTPEERSFKRAVA
jgi:hypothetical protein